MSIGVLEPEIVDTERQLDVPKTLPLQLVGRRFGRLVVLSRGENFGRTTGWLCVCDCGKRKVIRANSLMRAMTRSCGCLRHEVRCRIKTKHGQHGTPTYSSWQAMRARCLYPGHQYFKNYGGRGISICARWDHFENFLADIGERPPGGTLDRIDNDQNYEPENCKWSTRLEQGRNRRNVKVKA